jgi:hypothetical protein
MRSPITCCFTSPLKPLMLRLIIVTSCSSSNSSLVLLSLWYRLLAASSVVVVPVFDSLYLPRFCCCGAVMLVFFSCSLTLAFALVSFFLSFFWCVAFFAVPYFGVRAIFCCIWGLGVLGKCTTYFAWPTYSVFCCMWGFGVLGSADD